VEGTFAHPRLPVACAVMAAGLFIALTVVGPAIAAGPPIKTQQCSVAPLLPASFTLNDRLFVGNRSNIITGYTDLITSANGFMTGAPDMTLGGSNTLLSLVSRNYLVGMARDDSGRVYVAGPNTGTVNVYAAPTAGQNNLAPIGSLSAADGLSQPAGLAFHTWRNLLYVANAGNGTVTRYEVVAAGTVTFRNKITLSGLSAPRGLALNPDGTLLYVANRGSNSIALYGVGATPGFTAIPLAAPLLDLTGPIGIALNPAGTKLYVANNGKINGWYSVTIYDTDLAGRPMATAAHIGGDKTGLCNPATVAVDPTGSHLYVANRESSGGSITVYNLNADGSLRVPAGAPADFNVQPATMMLHDAVNQLGAPVGLIVTTP